MKLSEAIFIFERMGELNAPLSSLDEIDQYELTAYLMKSEKNKLSELEKKHAEMLLKAKLVEYSNEIRRANIFTSKYGQISGSGEQIEHGIEVLKYLTKLRILLGRVGINQDVSVYEAHRILTISENKEA